MADTDCELPLEVRTLSSPMENLFKDLPMKLKKASVLIARPQPEPPFRRPNCYESQNYRNDGHSKSGYGNQPRFPNRGRGRDNNRGRGSKPPNSFNRFDNSSLNGPNCGPPPLPPPTPTFFRKDYVQNSNWERPSRGRGRGRGQSFSGPGRGRGRGNSNGQHLVNKSISGQISNMGSTHESLDAHTAEHMICKLDGRKFTAHPNVVVNHIQMQHSTNLYEKIADYDTPEDTKVWINDRKKMYPSAENVERKRQENLERIEGGERISKPTFPKEPPAFVRRMSSAAAERNNELRRKRSGASSRPVSISGNKSEVVTLKSFYSFVKKNDKGVLEGKGLTLWTNSTNLRKMKEDPEPEPENGSDNENESGTNQNGCFTDEEEEPPAKIQKSGADVIEIESDGKVKSGIECTNDKKVGTENVDKTNQVTQPSGLLALVGYSSDSEMRDGEVRDHPEDTIINSKLQIESEVLTTSFKPICSIDQVKVPDISTESEKEKDSQVRKVAQVVSLARRRGGRRASRRLRQNVKNNFENLKKETQVAEADKSSKAQNEKEKSSENETQKVIEATYDQSSRTESILCTGKTQRKSQDVDKLFRRVKPRRRKKPVIVKNPVRRPLMLEHLLAPEIEYERNRLLQICRFITDNNYFEGAIGDSSDDEVCVNHDESKAENVDPVVPAPQTLENDNGAHN